MLCPCCPPYQVSGRSGSACAKSQIGLYRGAAVSLRNRVVDNDIAVPLPEFELGAGKHRRGIHVVRPTRNPRR